MTQALRIARALRVADRLDRDWMRKVDQDEDEKVLYTPWMPFPNRQFTALLIEAVPDAVEAGGAHPRFLDIGCGPGSKMIIAREVAGMDAHGFDRVPEYVQAAREQGLSVEIADALGWKSYADFHLIWFNRVFRDPRLQAQLEEQVWDGMAPATVVITANLENPPPPSRFHVILDDQEARRGIYLKATAPA